MTAYYNEIYPYAAQWLRNLISAGHIAPGEVDERSIVDVRSADLAGFVQCHFFAGLGGWSRALRVAGWPDDRSVWTGSCPCQPFSLAGRRDGFADARHLWPVWFDLIRERRPAIVFGEQVASATEWLGLVRGDLEAVDYAVGAMPVEAASAGADHLRDRYWFVANDGRRRCDGSGKGQDQQPWRAEAIGASHPSGLAHADQPCACAEREQRSGQQRGAGSDPEACDCGVMADTERKHGDRAGHGASDVRWQQRQPAEIFRGQVDYEWVIGADGKARRVKPGLRLLAHGVPARVAKLRALGNAIDPRPAAAFIRAADEAMRAAA